MTISPFSAVQFGAKKPDDKNVGREAFKRLRDKFLMTPAQLQQIEDELAVNVSSAGFRGIVKTFLQAMYITVEKGEQFENLKKVTGIEHDEQTGLYTFNSATLNKSVPVILLKAENRPRPAD